jgi:predicted nucleic acid-binding protein
MQIKQSKIVIDTNIWISYLITNGFKRLDKLIYSHKARLVFSQADFLITGDNDLLEIKNCGKTNILTISDFELIL